MEIIKKPLLHDGKTLALLKKSVGHDHAVPRPLFPIQVAQYIKQLKEETNDSSNLKTAKRLGVSTTIISDFLEMLKAPSKYNDVWGWNSYKGGRIPWSRYRRVCGSYDKKIITEEEFGMLINGVLDNELPTSLIEEIVALKKKTNKSFKDCWEDITNLIPKKIKAIIFIADLNPLIIQKIFIQAQKKSQTVEDLATSILANYIESEHVKGVLLKDNKYIKIELTEQGRKNLDIIVKKENVLVKDIIEYLFIKDGYGYE